MSPARRARAALGALLALSGAAAYPAEAQDPVTPFQRAKAAQLLRSELPCLGCHEWNGEGGRTAPSLTAIATRRTAAYIRAIVDDPRKARPGAAMPRHAMPPATRDLIVRVLSDGAAAGGAGAAPADVESGAEPNARPAPAPDARALYATWCASCHGASGGGDGPDAVHLPVKPARHADSSAMAARPDDSLFDVIAAGGRPWGRSARMPAFGGTLSPGEITQLVRHIRALCRCDGPPWSRPAGRP